MSDNLFDHPPIIGYLPSGKPVYSVAGGDPDPDPSGEPKGEPPPKDDSPKTFTQDEVNRFLKGEKDQWKRSTENEIADKLGMSPEDAAALIAKHKAEQEKEKSEAERAREAAEKEKAEAEVAKRAALADRASMRRQKFLVKAGVDPEKAERYAVLVDADLDADDDAVSVAVDALKKDSPELFGKPVEPGKKPPDGDPGGGPKITKAQEDAFKRGEERAKALSGR